MPLQTEMVYIALVWTEIENKCIAKGLCNAMETKKTKKAPVKPVVKPYLRGSITDGGTVRTALMVLGSMLLTCLANLLLTAALMWDNVILRVAVNGMVVAVIYMLYYQSGLNSGTSAVNQGEILYQRKESGRSVNEKDLAESYHPLKGLVAALLGVAPVFAAGVALALVAQRQMSGIGALPSWINGFEHRDEVGAALNFYSQAEPWTLEDGLRVMIRMLLMPYVNMVGTRNMDGLLTLERFSALLTLLPAVSYGWGYTQGVKVRSKIHTDIAAGKRKRAKREKKRRQARIRQDKGPEQLN